MILVFLCLTYFTQHVLENLQVHPYCCKWHHFIIFLWLDNTVFFLLECGFLSYGQPPYIQIITYSWKYQLFPGFSFFFQLQCVCCYCCCCLVAKSYPALCNSMDCSLPGSSVHGILQTITLQWVAVSFFKGSSQSRDRTQDYLEYCCNIQYIYIYIYLLIHGVQNVVPNSF